MLDFNFQPFPVLSTKRLVLRQIADNDVAEIFFLRSDARVLQYIDRTPLASMHEALQWIKMINDSIAKNEYITWGIQFKDEPALIGTITFWHVQKEHYRAEIGYLLHPQHHGKGLMQEAITAALQYGFNTMKLHSVEAHINPANNASKNLLLRNGFVQEGYFRENYYFNGRFLDTAVYSLIAP